MLLQNTNLSKSLVNLARKTATIIALLVTVGIGSSFATPTDNSNDLAIASFRKEFRTADVLKVESQKDFTKVTFNLNGVVMFAYYGETGNLEALVRNIVTTQLPIQLLMDMKQKHSDCWITDLFEINRNGQTIYYASLENSDTRYTLRADSSNGWDTYQKQTKQTE